jgi:NADH-quinone oxidoreductase subunit J
VNLADLFTAPVVLFAIFAFGALSTALMVVLSPNPVRSALYLVLNLFCVAVLYLLLNAYFLAAVQVIVYAGAIMVLFLFVIMLLNLGTPDRQEDRLRENVPVAIVGGVLLVGVLAWSLFSSIPAVAPPPDPRQGTLAEMGTPQSVGHTLYDPTQPWLLPFEVTSILLLIAVVGSVVLARRSSVGEGDVL